MFLFKDSIQVLRDIPGPGYTAHERCKGTMTQWVRVSPALLPDVRSGQQLSQDGREGFKKVGLRKEKGKFAKEDVEAFEDGR